MSFKNEYIIGSQVSGTTLSGGTIYSGATNIEEIFVYSGNSIGNGISIFSAKTYGNLIFNSLSGGSGINISDINDDGTLTFESVPGSEASVVVNASTTANLSSTSYDNGTAGIGATLTATTNGIIANQDGISIQVGYLLLVKNQSTLLENGIYYVNDIGSVSTPYILTRDTNSDETEEFSPQLVFVSSGTTQKGRYYNQSTADPEVGTDDIEYDLLGGINTYVTQSTVGTQKNGRVPTWNSVGRQLRKGNGTFVQNQSTDFVGIFAEQPNSTLDVAGSVGFGYTGVSVNWIADETDHTIVVNATSGEKTVTLPDANSLFRREYTIKKYDSTNNQVIISATTGTIGGQDYYILYNENDFITVKSNNTNWIKMGHVPFNTVSNLGSSTAIYSGTTGRTLFFKTLSAGTNVTITEFDGNVAINSSAGGPGGSGAYTDNGINTFTAGTSSFQSVNVTALTINTLTASGNSVFSGTLSGGSSFSASSIFSGTTNLENLFVTSGISLGQHAIFTGKTGNVLQFKGLKAGAGIVITPSSNYLTLYATIPTSAYIWNVGAGTSSMYAINGSLNAGYAAADYSIVAGNNNSIPAGSDKSTILNGRGNQIINASTYSTILNGFTNTIDGAIYSAIIGGKNYTLADSYTTLVPKLRIANLPSSTNAYFLVADSSGNVTKTAYSAPGGGVGATLWTADTGTNSIKANNGTNTASGAYSLVAGKSNNIATNGSKYASILGGNGITFGKGTNYSFAVTSKGGYIYQANFGGIVSGNSNRIYRTAPPMDSNYSTIINGKTHVIANSQHSNILAGQYNVISGASQVKSSVVIGGRSNRIFDENYSTIVNGRNNLIEGSYSYNSILNGHTNAMNRAGLSSILAGSGHTIDTAINSAIIGGSNYTLMTSNTVLVPLLRIANLPTASAAYSLVADASGNVTKITYAAAGEINTASSLGSGVAVYSGKVGVDLQFRSLTGGTGISTSLIGNEIWITYTGGTIQNGLNTYTGGTSSLPTVNVSALTINTITASGSSSFQTLSATTFYSGSTELSLLFGSGSGNQTYVQNGLNTYTGGTNSNPTVNVSALTINTLTASGNSVFSGTLSGGSSFSAATIYSGSTNIENLFVSSGNSLGSNAIFTGKTGNNLQFKGLSAGTNITITSESNALTVNTSAFVQKIVTVITATGAGTYTPTAGMKYVTVTVTGGGGASCDATNTDAVTGGGGGGGTAIKTYSAADIGVSQGYVVGTGGVRNTTPDNGVDTTFGAGGTLITGGGGTGSAAQTAAATLTLNFGGNGGTASGGDINVVGQAGTPGFILTTTIGVGGNGGSSYWGAGPTPTASDTAGTTGTNYGSGAAGAHASSTTDRLGANGAQGVIYIEEFI